MVATTNPTNLEVFPGRLHRAVRSWRLWVGAVVVAGLVAGWGMNFYNYAMSEGNAASVASLVKQKGSLSDQLRVASDARESLRGRLDSMTTQRDQLAAAEATLDRRTSAVKQREDAVKQREDAVKQRENAITKQEQTIAQNTIGEGDWAVGVDVQPGTYRTTEAVSGDCYWEINSDANGGNIVANDIVTGGRPTVTLENSQYFSTSRCGDWRKV